MRHSAEHGCPPAQHCLGTFYLYGQVVQKDMSEAVQWFRRAAEQGYAQAQNDIGYTCQTGDAGYTNLTEAYMWYQLATKQGVAKSKVNLNRLIPRLTPEQISEGDRRLSEFIPHEAQLPDPMEDSQKN